ncbi:adhesion G-protein coupled receptor G1-like isoform X2 [Megalops cyprinoides]|uniref:adhesion G-protein coupled receptor G1-like isoform X2 n=1 Tax=Megalops cyprinoides TaxID=118141 RepID=UPI001864D36A|nr:adhesion G-protein coupled receptor G1-like isoform X2 [Megalops cyprinoides]
MENVQCLLLFVLIAGTMSQAEIICQEVLNECRKNNTIPWTRCYDSFITTCHNRASRRRRTDEILNFYLWDSHSYDDVEDETREGHVIHIPREALGKRLRVNRSTQVAVTVFNSSLFQAKSETHKVMGGAVLGVMVGTQPVRNLPRPVNISFRHGNQNLTGGRCVFWEEPEDRIGAGRWSTKGCTTGRTGQRFVCSCDHLSFFAVLINPDVSVDPANAQALSIISSVGSGLSLLCTISALIMHLCLRKGKCEPSMWIHCNLTAALFLLHLLFLLSVWWAKLATGGAVCLAAGLLLHYSLLTTLTWFAIEGFHLYLLLVRVFNIYISRYLLKLGLVGWGVPMVTVIACALAGVYSSDKLHIIQDSNATASICWITGRTAQYITVSGYLGLVFLFSAAMLGVTMVKLWRVRNHPSRYKESRRMKMWRSCVTVLGIGCILGVPWGTAFATYGPLSLAGVYVFTILNGFQGVFVFLWFLTLTCQPHSEESSAGSDPTTQKMETSFNS